MRRSQKKVTSVLEANRLASPRVACHAPQQINKTVSGGQTDRIQWRAIYITERPEVLGQLHNPTIHFQDQKSLLTPPIPEPNESIQHPHILFVSVHFSIILAPKLGLKVVSSHHVFRKKKLYTPLQIVHVCFMPIPSHLP